MSSIDDVADYRRQVEAEVEEAAREQVSFRDLVRASKPPPGRRRSPMGLVPSAPPGDADDDLSAALAVLEDPGSLEELRSAAMQIVSLGIDERPEAIDRILELVAERGRPTPQRGELINLLQMISFRLVAFPGKRAAYLETLRGMVDDPDADLRRRVIGILAREKDEYVQRRLVEGLVGESKALVPAAKAIQFLGYDVHAEHFPMLRQIVEDPPTKAARMEAIRLLAGDPSSVKLLLAILKDRGERPEVRRLAATSLQSLAPDKLAAEARRIVLDDGEDDGLRATLLDTFAYFTEGRSPDSRLARRVEQLRTGSSSRHLKQASEDFMSRRPT